MIKESQNAQLVALLHDSLLAHTSQYAFCIDDKMWTYGQLMKRVAAIRCAVRECESIIGLVANDDLKYLCFHTRFMDGRPLLRASSSASTPATLQGDHQSGRYQYHS